MNPEQPFLTREQLEELTGLVQPAAQRRWLRKERVKHFVRADGKPMVLWSALEGRSETRSASPAQPNFEALRAAR